MNIGEAAALSGLPAKTIRYYEDVGLLPRPVRGGNGYRHYGDKEVNTLRFLKRARALGFSVEDCRELLSLYGDRERRSADVKAVALARVAEIDRRIADMEGMRRALEDLAARCHGDERPDCPILDDLGAGDGPARSRLNGVRTR